MEYLVSSSSFSQPPEQQLQYPAIPKDLQAASPYWTRLMVSHLQQWPSPRELPKAGRHAPQYFRVLQPGNFPPQVLRQRCALVFNDLWEVSLPSCASVSPARKWEKNCPSFYKNLLATMPILTNSFKKVWTEIHANICKTYTFKIFLLLCRIWFPTCPFVFPCSCCLFQASELHPRWITVV